MTKSFSSIWVQALASATWLRRRTAFTIFRNRERTRNHTWVWDWKPVPATETETADFEVAAFCRKKTFLSSFFSRKKEENSCWRCPTGCCRCCTSTSAVRWCTSSTRGWSRRRLLRTSHLRVFRRLLYFLLQCRGVIEALKSIIVHYV